MLTVEELDHLWYVLEGRMNHTVETQRIAQKIYQLKEIAKVAGKKEIQVII